MRMRAERWGVVVAATLFVSAPVQAQERPRPEAIAPGLVRPRPNSAPPVAQPPIDPDPSAQAMAMDDVARVVIGSASLASGALMILYSVAALRGERQGLVDGRDQQARAIGAGLIGGAGMVAQGATLLVRDGAEARRRGALAASAEVARYNPVLGLMERDVVEAERARKTKGALVMVLGTVAGAGVALLPVPDDVVDRRVLVGAGSAIALGSLGAGAYLLVTPPPEVKVLDEAMDAERQGRALVERPRGSGQ